jgi:hypothetical protein
VACHRAIDAGEELAHAILAHAHGHRPITLMGFSMGARVIYFCLKTLAKSKHGRGIVQDVFLFGCPVSGSADDWAGLVDVVGGRLVNGFCSKDWLLKFLFRGTHASVCCCVEGFCWCFLKENFLINFDFFDTQFVIAGLTGVEHPAVENIDLTAIVSGHLAYRSKMSAVLRHVRLARYHDNEIGFGSIGERVETATGSQGILRVLRTKPADDVTAVSATTATKAVAAAAAAVEERVETTATAAPESQTTLPAPLAWAKEKFSSSSLPSLPGRQKKQQDDGVTKDMTRFVAGMSMDLPVDTPPVRVLTVN